MLPDAMLLELLRSHGVRFVVIGGHAVYFHGYDRLTEDTDVVWLRSGKSELALLAALTEVDACYIGDEIDPKTGIERTHPVTLPYIRAHHLMMLWTKCGFLDLFDYLPNVPNESVEQLFDASVESGGIRYASLQFLRKMKAAAGRTKDLLDLENLPEA